MIRIDKGAVPKETIDKNNELAKDLKTVYKILIGLYEKKEQSGDEIKLTKDDRKTLSDKSSLKASHRALGNVVFGEEIFYSVKETRLPTTEKMDSLRKPWDGRMTELIKQYEAIRANVSKGYAAKLQLKSEDMIAEFTRRAATCYEQQALRTGRPFCDWTGATKDPRWFDGEELRTWTAFAGMSPEVQQDMSRDLLVNYQSAMGIARGECVKDTDYGWMVLTVWMAADPDRKLGKSDKTALFEYAKRVWDQRLTQGRWLSNTMTFAEIKRLPRKVKEAGDTAFYFLAVHALGDVMEPPAPAKPTVRYRPLIGFGSDAFDNAYYSGHGIKEVLMTAHYGKCVFCESKVRAIAHGDVEHFRPKAGYEQGHAFNNDGYFWRAYEWGNLYYSCQVCNQVRKGNQFPVLLDKDGVEVRKTYRRDDEKESPVLIDPGMEDPREFIRFDPRTGHAYAYDWLKEYLERDSKTITQEAGDVATAIWMAPRLIPDLTGQATDSSPGKSPDGISVSVDVSAWSDMAASMPGRLLRGTRTIQILGLNRAELVSRRVAHLRALRGLFVTATGGSGPEKDAADTAIEESMKPNGEFSSLSIDAVRTWKKEEEWRTKNPKFRAYPWIECYNEMLAEPLAYSYEEGWSEKDIPVMYFVAGDKTDPDAKRTVVYLTQKDELDDSDTQKGWYLEIPEEDFDLTLTVKRSGKTEQLTIAKLLKLKQPWRKFSGATVTATGPFSMSAKFI